MLRLWFTLFLLTASSNVLAYLGPGMGGGAIAAVLGLIVAIFLGLFSVLYYPIKRALRKRGTASEVLNQDEDPAENGGS